MGYNEIIGIMNPSKSRMTVGSYGQEVQEPNSAYYSFTKSLERIIYKTVNEYSTKLYSVLVPRVLTYDYIDRYIAPPYEINLGSMNIETGNCSSGYGVIDPNNLSHVVVNLSKILTWGCSAYKPTIIEDKDKKEVRDIIDTIIKEYTPDPMELVSFKLEEDVLQALKGYKEHLEKTYPDVFKVEIPEVRAPLLRMDLNDGLITPNYSVGNNVNDDVFYSNDNSVPIYNSKYNH